MSAHEKETVWITVSTCSMVASFSVLLTGFLFPALQREFYFRLILMISLCDFFSCIIGTWGFPQEEDTCKAQAIILKIFLPAVWIWCTVVSCTMYFHIDHGRVYVSFLHMNYIVWSIVLITILVCVPELATNELFYGCHTRLLGKQFGTLRSTDDGDDMIINDYLIGTFVAPCICCIGIMTLTAVLLNFVTIPRIRRVDPAKADRIIPLMWYISMYPIGLAIFWLPHMITVLMAADTGASGDYYGHPALVSANYITFYIGYGYGIYMAIVFFSNSKAARENWTNIIKRCLGIRIENPLLADLEGEDGDDDSVQLTVSEIFTGTPNTGRSRATSVDSRGTVATRTSALRFTILENRAPTMSKLSSQLTTSSTASGASAHGSIKSSQSSQSSQSHRESVDTIPNRISADIEMA